MGEVLRINALQDFPKNVRELGKSYIGKWQVQHYIY